VIDDRAKNNVKKLLMRWRPEVLKEDEEEEVKMEGVEGVKESANGVLEVKAV
jgi:symplekin